MPENKPTKELYGTNIDTYAIIKEIKGDPIASVHLPKIEPFDIAFDATPDRLFTIYITDEIHDIISRMRARGICPSEFICGCLRLADSAWLSECEAVNRSDDNSFPF